MDAVRIVQGRVVPLERNDVDTDQIIPSDWLKQVERTGFEKGLFSEWRDDPDFVMNKEEHAGANVLLAGPNFGTGSSREQAATCIKFFGIPLVIAGSFSETYKRNAFNNGFLCIECPELLLAVRESSSSSSATARTGIMVEVDFSASVARAAGREFPLSPLGPAAQDLVLAGGLEALVSQKLAN